MPIRGVLFDLDGTLADTAPDLIAALYRLCAEDGRPAPRYDMLRPHVSKGSRGLIEAGLGLRPGDPDFEVVTQRFLNHYATAICVNTILFHGMEELLGELESRHIHWGIVTNKPHRFTLQVMTGLGLAQRAACMVSGDTCAHAKPHPAPVLHACDLTGIAPNEALYVGDDLRDIQAGRAAGLGTIAAAYGYLGDNLPISDWCADHVIDHPLDLLNLLNGH
ncbi:MAG: HAD family hydrolase [Rhodocyclaceae bacterium]|nr:HAD family hydrolase [Rhodocyclaceae bacterium]